MEEKISKLYVNPEDEIKSLSIENLSYLHAYFKEEYIFQKYFYLDSTLQCIRDRKKVSRIYKSLNSEIKKRCA